MTLKVPGRPAARALYWQSASPSWRPWLAAKPASGTVTPASAASALAALTRSAVYERDVTKMRWGGPEGPASATGPSPSEVASLGPSAAASPDSAAFASGGRPVSPPPVSPALPVSLPAPVSAPPLPLPELLVLLPLLLPELLVLLLPLLPPGRVVGGRVGAGVLGRRPA